MTGAPISGIRDCHPRHSTDYNTLATYDVHSKEGRRLSDGGEGRPFRWKLLGTSLYNYFMRVPLLCDSAQCRPVTVTVWLGNECAGMSFYSVSCVA